MRLASGGAAVALAWTLEFQPKRKGTEAPFQAYRGAGSQLPLMPVMSSVSPTGVPMMPVVPTVSPATVPTVPAPTTEVMRVVVTVTVAGLVPAVAPSVADVSDLFNVRGLRGLVHNGDRHRRRSCGRECNSSERYQSSKCRNKFHDIHLLTLVGGRRSATGSAHYSGLMPMNNCFPIFNPAVSNDTFVGAHQFL